MVMVMRLPQKSESCVYF